MITQIKIRRDESVRWALVNPILLDGEPGYERDTKRMKIGDGVTAWNQLSYSFLPGGQAETTERRYKHEQGAALRVWRVTHNLGTIPAAVAVIDSGNNVVHGGVVHLSVNEFELHFSAPFSGKVIVTA